MAKKGTKRCKEREQTWKVALTKVCMAEDVVSGESHLMAKSEGKSTPPSYLALCFDPLIQSRL